MSILGYEIGFWHVPLAVAIVLNLVATVVLVVRATSRTKAFWYFILFLIWSELWAIENFVETIPGLLGYDLFVWVSNASFSIATLGLYFFLAFSKYVFSENAAPPPIFLTVIAYGFGVVGFFTDLYFVHATRVPGGTIFEWGVLYYPLAVLVLVLFGWSVWNLTCKIRKAGDFSNKMKLVLILGGFVAIFCIGFVLTIVIPQITGVSEYGEITPVGILVFLLVLSWGVLRYHLFEVRVHITRADVVALLTLVGSVTGLALFSAIVFWAGTSPWLYVFVVVFSIVFLKLKDGISRLVYSRTFNDYIDPHLDILVEKSEMFQQILQLRESIQAYFAKYFQNTSVDVFYLHDATHDFRSSRPKRRGMLLAPNDPFVDAVRKFRGVVFAEDIAKSEFVTASEKAMARARLKRLEASALIGMRHWTNELAMIAVVGFDAPSEEELKRFKINLEFDAPQWDEIAAKIYTNKRAMESVSRQSTKE